MQVAVNHNLQEAYKNQYSFESAVWRGLGAKQKFQNILKITSGKYFNKVLEVGAGDGSVLQLLSENNFAQELYAVEISESGVTQINAKNIDSLKSVQLFNGYVLPFEDKSFDLVILTHVLEHVEHERILLREIHRVSRQLLIEVPKDYRFGAEQKLAHFLSYGHINLYTPTSLKFLLMTENFKIQQELTGLYHRDSFLFGQKTFLQKMKGYLVYFGKKLLTNTPFQYFNHKFINTITFLTEAEDTKMTIF
ncbi:MAG: class I SAM-dependent methyltransferase [Arcicella sp.]|jgi:ubiquinone/menaquinone biosynthesis C-methylase UbiE|nr:class I SAM-dependent methyltransferase [Arcicella sp.]